MWTVTINNTIIIALSFQLIINNTITMTLTCMMILNMDNVYTNCPYFCLVVTTSQPGRDTDSGFSKLTLFRGYAYWCMMKSTSLICFISSLFLTVTGECGGDVRWRDRDALSVMMSSTETRCADINLTTQRRVCKVLSEDDEKKLLCGGNGRDVNCDMPISLCPDGILNKTCFPVSDSNSIHYMCFCYSARDHQMYVPTATQTSWSPWQRLTGHNKGYNYTRKVYMCSSSECLLEEYDSLIFINIISEYQLLDSIFSASSTWATSHAPDRARIDKYFTATCAWGAGVVATSEWLQIHLLENYSVGGILITKRCDLNQYPTALTVKTYEDDLQWQDVIVNRDLLYTGDAANLWFSQIYTSPVWRVYITAYYGHPAMQCDLKGLFNNWCNEIYA